MKLRMIMFVVAAALAAALAGDLSLVDMTGMSDGNKF